MQFQCVINYQLKPRVNHLICILIFDFWNQDLFPTLEKTQVLSNLIFLGLQPETSYATLYFFQVEALNNLKCTFKIIFRVQIKRVYDKYTYQNEIQLCTVQWNLGIENLQFCHHFFFQMREFYSVIHFSIHPSKELCSKMAPGEVGVSLP